MTPPSSLYKEEWSHNSFSTLCGLKTGLTNADDFYAVNVTFQHTILYCVEY